MKTIALRFSDNFAPPNGTIVEHKKNDRFKWLRLVWKIRLEGF